MWKPHNIFSLSVNILLLVLPLWVYNESENEGVIMIIIVMYKVHLSTQQKIYKEIWREKKTITYAIDVLNGRLFLAKRFTRSNYFQSENGDEDNAPFHIFPPQVTTDNELCRVRGNTWKCDIELDRE